jgi:hypothetical protein
MNRIDPVSTRERPRGRRGWVITTTETVAESPAMGTWETLRMMRRRAEVGGRKHTPKSSKASEGRQRGRSRQRAGKPHTRPRATASRGTGVATLLHDHVGASQQMSAARERTVSPLRRPPCAVNAARTVTTGGMEKRAKRYRARSLPAPSVSYQGRQRLGPCHLTPCRW